MKTIIVLFIAISTSFASYAQKAKNNLPPDKDAAQQITYVCPMHPGEISDTPGKCAKCGMALVGSKKEQMKKTLLKDYACEMHPGEVSDTPGKCTKCGRSFVKLNTYSCPLHPDFISHKPGTCPKCGSALVLSGKEQMKSEVMKQYACPMHPDVVSSKSGKCPKCGMALVEKSDSTSKQ